MALINLRNALMSGKRLPYDAEVEYLESTGKQWIDTGVIGASEWHITAQGTATPSASNCVIATKSSGGSFWGAFRGYNYWAVGSAGDSTNYRITLPYTSLGAFVVNFNSNSVTFTDGVETATRNSTPNFSVSFCLFSTHGGSYAAKVKIYGCKVYQNSVLVRDYIPVRKGTTGELYDRVSGKFAERHGDFQYGQDVVPVEYIESHGTEYIITGYSSTGVGIRATVSCEKTTSATSEMSIVGRDSNDGFDIYFSGGKCGLWNNGSSGSIISDVAIVADTRYSINAAVHSSGGSLSVNGESKTLSFSPATPSAANIVIFRHNHRYYFVGKIYDCELYDNDVLIRKFRPVRVGSGSTWEGAMMDVLTCRIYRNQGTGAFGYGNDLKYPIPAE